MRLCKIPDNPKEPGYRKFGITQQKIMQNRIERSVQLAQPVFQKLLVLVMVALLQQCSYSQSNKKEKQIMDNENKAKNPVYSRTDSSTVNLSEEEWKKLLPKEVYYIARQKGTERPWTSKYEDFDEKGTYYCAVCGNALFVSDTKFESGCGWPSFYQPVSKGSIIYEADNSHGMKRTEVMCGRCKSHLGHVFEDGPPPTGLRYCINGVVLDFEKAKEAEKKYEGK
jgi:peptide-methionine (R)-S-oxide reductase